MDTLLTCLYSHVSESREELRERERERERERVRRREKMEKEKTERTKSTPVHSSIA